MGGNCPALKIEGDIHLGMAIAAMIARITMSMIKLY
jgi:hypothetical protein